MYLVMTVLGIYKYIGFVLQRLSHNCSRYSHSCSGSLRNMKYIYSTSQMSKLSLTLCTFSITGSVAGLFLTAGKSIDRVD